MIWFHGDIHDHMLLRYSVVKRADNEQLLLVATERMNNLASILGTNLESVATFAGRSTVIGQNDAFWTGLSINLPLFHSSPGSDLEGGVCQHPTIPSKEVPLLPANHVTMTKGTGLVHTAPAHGMEDYSVATHFNLPVVRHPHLYSICWNSKNLGVVVDFKLAVSLSLFLGVHGGWRGQVYRTCWGWTAE